MASSALAMGRRYADQWAIAMCTTILGHFALATGDIPAAREHLAEGAEAFERIGNPLYLTWNLEGRAVLASVDRLLKEAGSDKSKLLQAIIWLADMKDFAEMNAVWDKWVDGQNAPARATGEAKLATPEYLVEIIITAAV